MSTPASSTDPGSRSAAEIEREVQQSRADIEHTLDAIQERLSPGQLFDEALGYFRGGRGAEFTRNLGNSIAANPVPIALMGVGLAWMMVSGQRSAHADRRSAPDDWEEDLDPIEDEYVAFAEQDISYLGPQSDPGGGLGEDLTEAGHTAREKIGEMGDRASDAAARARDRAREAGAQVRDQFGRARPARRERAHDARRRARHYGDRARQGLLRSLDEQPLVLGAIGLAIGAALGAALPPTETEDELMGETRDKALRRATAMGREQAEKVRETAGAVAAAARDEAGKQGWTAQKFRGARPLRVRPPVGMTAYRRATAVRKCRRRPIPGAGLDRARSAPSPRCCELGAGAGGWSPSRPQSVPEALGEDRIDGLDHFRSRPFGGPAGANFRRRGWRDILWRVWSSIGEDNVSIVAAGVAFYSMLALFPAITAFVSLFGLVSDPGQVQQQFANLRGVIPDDGWSILNDQLTAVASAQTRSLGISALISLVIALWSAGAGVRAMMIALNIAYKEHERRSFIRFYGTAFLFTIGIALLGGLALGVIVVVPVLLSMVDLGPLTQHLLRWLPWLVLAGFVAVALAFLYRYGASRQQPKTRWVSWGAVVATALWIAASLVFSIYVANFGSYNETYGALGAVVILLMWLWISAFIVLLGAELNAEMEHQTDRDTTTGRAEAARRAGRLCGRPCRRGALTK